MTSLTQEWLGHEGERMPFEKNDTETKEKNIIEIVEKGLSSAQHNEDNPVLSSSVWSEQLSHNKNFI